MLPTNKNCKYYFYICGNAENISNITSDEYDNKIDCIKDFLNALKIGKKKIAYGQFYVHHYADEWCDEKKEIEFIISHDEI